MYVGREEEKEMMLVAIIAQGRVPENPYAIELHNHHRLAGKMEGFTEESLPGCALPSGSGSVRTFLTCKQVKEIKADTGQAGVRSVAMASAAPNFLGQAGDPKNTPPTL